MGRKQGCVIKTSAATTPTTKTNTKKVMPHDEFMKRMRKSLYFANDFCDEDFETMEVSKPLAEYASELFSDAHRGHTLNRLSCVEASSMPSSTPTALIMALIYLDRLNVTDPGYVRRITPQELFIVSMMISAKFYAGHDEEFYLSDWAEDGNISKDRLKLLELEFLCAIDWNIYISNEQFFDKLTSIEKTLARREGLKRGWLTYTELIQMLPSFTLAKFLLNNITVMAVSYAASVMTIAGAFFLASQIPGTLLHSSGRSATGASHTSNNTDMLNDSEIATTTKDARNSTTTSASSVVIMRQHNHTTNLGLNVEDELLKLDRQYREEAIRDTMRQKNNEITTESRLTLPQQQLMAKLNVNQKCAKYDANQQQQRRQLGHWFVHKEQYSRYAVPHKVDKFQQPPLMTQLYEDSEDIFMELKKATTTTQQYNNASMAALLWHFLTDTVQQHTTFVRIPFVWLKFM